MRVKSLSVLTILITSTAWGFPDLMRHGYANCTACHVSPSGGGVLTEYGREISKDLLSHWSDSGEERLAYGINQPDWLKIGGDYRDIQTYVDNPARRDANFFNMQSELEAAVQVHRWTADMTAGLQGGPQGTPQRGQLISRQHYLSYRPSEQTSVRVGRFRKAYGLNGPNHTIVTERNLQWDQGSETYNAEASYFADHQDFTLTAVMGRPDDTRIDGERGAALSIGSFFLDRMKIGLSAFRGHTNAFSRDVAGFYGVFGLTKKVYLLSEIDEQWLLPSTDNAVEQRGIVSYQQLNYEWTQGFHLYAVQQLSYLDFNSVLSRSDSWGLGLQIFPRPHFEFDAEYAKLRVLSPSTTHIDSGWVLLHFYL